MKSFQKFIVLTIISFTFYFSFFFFLIRGNINLHLDGLNAFSFPKLLFFSCYLGYFAIATFSYVYIFERLQQIKEFVVRNILIAVGSLFILIIVYNGFVLGNIFFTTNKNIFNILTANYFLCICTFFFQYLGTTLAVYSLKSHQLVFDEKRLFYIKLIASVTTIVSVFGMVFILGQVKSAFPTFDYLSADKLSSIFLEIVTHCLFVTALTLFFIWVLSRFYWFSKNSVILVLLLFLVQMFILKMQVRIYDYQYLESTFDPSVLSGPILVVVLLYRNKQKKTDSKIKSLKSVVSKKEAEYLQLKQQVNPHFLFNNLNTLISFIEINPKKAVEFGHHLSNTYRHYLKNEKDDFVSLREELEFIKGYLEIYKAKFETGISFEITVQPEENQFILSLVLQEVVDNIFKHNTIDENNPLQICIYSQENELYIENSISKKAVDESSKTGLENINKRYEILANKQIQIISQNDTYQVILPILELEA